MVDWLASPWLDFSWRLFFLARVFFSVAVDARDTAVLEVSLSTKNTITVGRSCSALCWSESPPLYCEFHLYWLFLYLQKDASLSRFSLKFSFQFKLLFHYDKKYLRIVKFLKIGNPVNKVHVYPWLLSYLLFCWEIGVKTPLRRKLVLSHFY